MLTLPPRVFAGFISTAVGLFTLLSCGSSEESTGLSGATAGEEGGPCLKQGGCDVGLVCTGGKCVKAGGTGGTGGTTGTTDANSDAAECSGSHPLIDASARFCAEGQCRCLATDSCFPQTTAAKCCAGQLECFTSDGGVECNGTHPIVDGGSRTCSQGVCYCSANDTCYPSATAFVCCSVSPTCA